MENLTLTEINVFPVKSLAGISLNESVVEERGLKLDRRWMLVDENNRFITQRVYPQLALLKVGLGEGSLLIQHITHGSVEFNLKEKTGNKLLVNVWDSICEAQEVSEMANNYFSTFLNKSVRLVYMPQDSIRLVDKNYSYNNDIVSFADGFPILVIGRASLVDLNSRLSSPISMTRFRPNLVVSTSIPFDEDDWQDFAIGNTFFKAVKPCSRCIMVTVDPESGNKGAEPLKTLATYRTINNKVMFGQNVLIGGGSRIIKVGDAVKVLSRRNI